MEYHHYCRPLVYVVFISILPLIYTQNALEDHVNIQNVARKEAGFYTKCGPEGDVEPDDGNVTSKPEDYVKAHNAARKEVGVGPMEWNTTLAEFAQNYANTKKDCVLVHSERNGGMYGENLAWGGVANDAVVMWCSEKANWDSVSKTCAPGKGCGHYAQVVDPASTQVGCGRVKCTTEKYAYFVICNYYPF